MVSASAPALAYWFHFEVKDCLDAFIIGTTLRLTDYNLIGAPRRSVLSLSWATLLLILSTAAMAGSPTSVKINVMDANSRPVAGASVEISRGGQIVSNATSDDHGVASLTLPGGGKYQLKVSRYGYVTSDSSLQIVEDGSPQQVDLVLNQAALSKQEVEVTDTSLNPTTEVASTPETLSVKQAKATSDRPATLKDALPLVPGVVRATDGTVQIAGFGETHSALLVNSVNVTDPATGGFGLSIPIDSVETISVSEMPYLAEYGKFTAGVVAAETKRGGEKWDWSLNDPFPDFKIRSRHLQGVRDASPRLNFWGPIIKNKLYFVEGAEYLMYKRDIFTLPYGQNESKSTAINSYSQLDWIISDKHTLTTSYHIAPQSIDYAGLNFFNPQSAVPNADFRESTATIIDRYSIGGGLLTSTFANTNVSSGIVPQGPGAMILTPGGNLGNYYNRENRRATRYQWLENWKPRTLHWLGGHALSFGSMMSHSENDGTFSPHPVIVEDQQGHVLQRIDFTGNGSFDLSDMEPAVYAQDHWMVNPHLAFDMGLRFESQKITHTFRSAPRVGFVYNPAKWTNTVFRGGFGVFYDSVPLDVYAFNSYPQQTITNYDASGAIINSRTYLNVMDTNDAQNGFDFVHRSLVAGNFAPYSIAGDIEVEQNFGHLLQLRFKYLQSVAKDQITIAPHVIGTQGVFLLGSAGTARSHQFEFISRIGANSTRQFFFSYVRQYARGDINDANSYLGNFPFPVVRQGVYASLPSEIPNRFLLWGTTSLPKRLTFAPKIELRNGFPYQYTDVYQNYLTPAGLQPRFPRYFSADISLAKDFDIGKKHTVRLAIAVQNITNHFNALEVHSNMADPLFGTFMGNYGRRVTLNFDVLK